MPKHYKLAVVMPGAVHFASRVCDGICEALAKYPDWIIRTVSTTEMGRITKWQPNAIITNIANHSDIERFKSFDIPVVNYSGVMRNSGFTTVRVDDIAVGKMAANYMLDLGLKNFAYWGAYNSSFAFNRFEGFRSELLKKGVDENNIYTEDFSTLMDWRQRDKRIAHWLKGLPKPLGLFSMTDQQAYYICEIANEIGIDIPNQLALLGVDNDPIHCKLSRPNLSTIQSPAFQVGRKTVELVAEMLFEPEKHKDTTTVLIPPISVIERGSTDMLAVGGEQLREAIMYIRQNACKISVEDILRQIPISRSSLEKKFKAAFGRSPGAEIRRIRIEKAQKLLLNTKKPIGEIAQLCGFCDSQYLSKVFMRETKIQPSVFRRNYGLDS